MFTKRVMICLMVLALVFTSFGCSQTESNDEKKVETFSLVMYTDWYKAGWENVIKYIDENQESLGFRLEVELISGGTQGAQLLKTRFASDEEPDFFEYYAAKDIVLDLGGKDKALPIEGEWMKGYSEDLLKSKFYSIDGKVVGVPIDPQTLVGTFYNKAIFDELNLEVPNNWDELLAVCKEIKAAGKVPFFYPGKDVWALTMTLNEGFIREYEAQGMSRDEFFEAVNNNELKFEDMPQVADAVQKSKELIELGYVQETYLSDNYDMSQKALAEGDCAMIFQGTWVMDEIYGKYPDKAEGIGAFAVPLEADKVTSFVPFGLFMSNKIHNREKGQEVIEFLASKETQQMFADAQPGLWSHKEVQSELLPAVADMKKFIETDKTIPWFGYGFEFQGPTFDVYIQDYYVNARELVDIFTEADSEYKKNAIANGAQWD